MTTIITGMRNFIEKHIGGTLLSCRLNCAIKMELRVVTFIQNTQKDENIQTK